MINYLLVSVKPAFRYMGKMFRKIFRRKLVFLPTIHHAKKSIDIITTFRFSIDLTNSSLKQGETEQLREQNKKLSERRGNKEVKKFFLGKRIEGEWKKL